MSTYLHLPMAGIHPVALGLLPLPSVKWSKPHLHSSLHPGQHIPASSTGKSQNEPFDGRQWVSKQHVTRRRAHREISSARHTRAAPVRGTTEDDENEDPFSELFLPSQKWNCAASACPLPSWSSAAFHESFYCGKGAEGSRNNTKLCSSHL